MRTARPMRMRKPCSRAAVRREPAGTPSSLAASSIVSSLCMESSSRTPPLLVTDSFTRSADRRCRALTPQRSVACSDNGSLSSTSSPRVPPRTSWRSRMHRCAQGESAPGDSHGARGVHLSRLREVLPALGAVKFAPAVASAERALRGIATGRRSWLFASSAHGGERVAAMYTFQGTVYRAATILEVGRKWVGARVIACARGDRAL